MNTEIEALARMAGFFSEVEIDRDGYPTQHPQFVDHCYIWSAAIIIVACAMGMLWSLYLFPLDTLIVSGLIGCSLIAVNVIQMARGSE